MQEQRQPLKTIIDDVEGVIIRSKKNRHSSESTKTGAIKKENIPDNLLIILQYTTFEKRWSRK